MDVLGYTVTFIVNVSPLTTFCVDGRTFTRVSATAIPVKPDKRNRDKIPIRIYFFPFFILYSSGTGSPVLSYQDHVQDVDRTIPVNVFRNPPGSSCFSPVLTY